MGSCVAGIFSSSPEQPGNIGAFTAWPQEGGGDQTYASRQPDFWGSAGLHWKPGTQRQRLVSVISYVTTGTHSAGHQSKLIWFQNEESHVASSYSSLLGNQEQNEGFHILFIISGVLDEKKKKNENPLHS